ncbi:hypothetical protein QJS66_22525 [Kocuria rhizophila]|nr:hypothetical protein QJS66_22525 [Kocuria rhizophila]
MAALLVAILRGGRDDRPLEASPMGLAMLVVVAVVAGGLYPSAIQRFQVTPPSRRSRTSTSGATST